MSWQYYLTVFYIFFIFSCEKKYLISKIMPCLIQTNRLDEWVLNSFSTFIIKGVNQKRRYTLFKHPYTKTEHSFYLIFYLIDWNSTRMRKGKYWQSTRPRWCQEPTRFIYFLSKKTIVGRDLDKSGMEQKFVEAVTKATSTFVHSFWAWWGAQSDK